MHLVKDGSNEAFQPEESSSASAGQPAVAQKSSKHSRLRIRQMRQEIDSIDEELARLLLLRLELAEALGCLKAESDIPVKDRQREADVLARIEDLSRQSPLSEHLLKLYRLILNESCLIQASRLPE